MESADQIIKGKHYLTGKFIEISVKNGLIASVMERQHVSGGNQVHYLAPGLIDNQVNGYAGIDFSDTGLTINSFWRAVKEIVRDGVTTFLPVVVTGDRSSMKKSLSILSESLMNDEFAAVVPGIHLEGPWLSPVQGFYGCHPPKHLGTPSVKDFLDFQEAAGGRILEITIAPELENAMEVIRYCSGNGIKVALGHSNADSSTIMEAVRCGATLSTHLGNGCANLIDRHRNPIWPQLANDGLTATIIADGHHLLPEELKVFVRSKGKRNIIITSDVNFLIGMKPGTYDYMGSRIEMTSDGLVIVPELKCLAGASMPLRKGIETLVKYSDLTLAEAIETATVNVARALTLTDRGSLEPGFKADLIAFDFENGQMNIVEVYKEGMKLVNS